MEEVRKVQIKNFIKKTFDIEIDDKYIKDYDHALTHYNDQRTGGTREPERLAFLGDSYLDFIVAKYLYNHKDNLNLGKMDLLKQQLVANENWQKIAKKIGLDEQIVTVVHGIGHPPQRFDIKIEDKTILARSFEALAAVLSYGCLDTPEEKLIALFIKLGYLQNELGLLEESLARYDKAIEINPKDEKAWVDKGFLLDIYERYEEALACYDKAIEINPKVEYAWIHKGTILYGFGRYEEALACYDKAIEIHPKDGRVWDCKSWALDSLGRDEEASACHDKAQNLFRGL